MKKLFTLAAVLVAAMAMNAAQKMWNVSDWDVATIKPTMVGDTITSSFTVDGLQVLATDKRNDKLKLVAGVIIDGNNKTWKSADESETIKFTQRLKLMGKSGADNRQLIVPITKGATIEVWGMASGDGERPIVIGDKQWDGEAEGLSSFTPNKTDLGYHSYVYNGDAEKLYIWGSANGVNIYGVRVTDATATGINNTEAEVKTVKAFENGQLVIIKNGVKYNATGAIVK